MNLLEMRKAVRADLDDNERRKLWSDPDLNRWINEAEREACRRARLITESTSRLASAAFRIGDPLFKLDSRVIFVKRLKIIGDSRPLPKTSVRDLDCERPGWEDDTGWPTAWMADRQSGYVSLDRTPEEAMTANMIVVRVPLNEMADDDSKPEIADRYHENLLHWVRFRAYSRQDTATFNPQSAADALSLFEQEFGKRSTAQDETFIAANNDFEEYQGAY